MGVVSELERCAINKQVPPPTQVVGPMRAVLMAHPPCAMDLFFARTVYFLGGVRCANGVQIGPSLLPRVEPEPRFCTFGESGTDGVGVV